MVKRSLLMAGIWACGSFGLTLAILSPARLGAAGPSTRPIGTTPVKITQNGVELSMQYDGKPVMQGSGIAYDGKQPLLVTLLAVNTTDQPAEIPASINLWSTPVAGRLSRTPMRSIEVYQSEQSISLAPNETRQITITPETKITTPTVISASLRSGGETPVSALGLQPGNLAQTLVQSR